MEVIFEVSQILGERLELAYCGPRIHAVPGAVTKAVFDMVLDQLTLGICDGALHGMELLGEIDAGSTIAKHGHEPASGGPQYWDETRASCSILSPGKGCSRLVMSQAGGGSRQSAITAT